jgi:hypothetical protein
VPTRSTTPTPLAERPLAAAAPGAAAAAPAALCARQLQAARCPLCTQAFGASGRHQVCSLPCGHVYGRSCITSHLFRKSTCPLCAAAARRSAIRLLFAGAQQPAAAATAEAAAPSALELEARTEEATCERLEAELAVLVAEQVGLERRATELQAARLLGGRGKAPAPMGPAWCVPTRPRSELERRVEHVGERTRAPACGGTDRPAGLLADVAQPLGELRNAAVATNATMPAPVSSLAAATLKRESRVGAHGE